MEVSACGSQNICLKLTQDSTTISSPEDEIRNEDSDVIIISDSGSTCSEIECIPKPKLNLKKYSTKVNEQYVVDSSESNSLDSEDRYFQVWRTNKENSSANHDKEYKNIANGTGTCVSDSISCSSNELPRKYINNSNKTSSNYISTTPQNSIFKETTQLYNRNIIERNILPSSPISNNSSKSSSRLNRELLATKSSSDSRINLTKKDAKNIIKNIKSAKLVYESPRQKREKEESMNNDMHPAISPTNNLRNYKIIDETPVDSGSDIVPDSQDNQGNICKTDVNRILDVPSENKNAEIDCTELSERKRKQISQWLLLNSPDSQSDSSVSNIPASNEDCINSGNSSLERLEQVYETPNNRGKINCAPVSDKTLINQNCSKVIESVVARQTTIHDFVHRSHDNGLELRTAKKKYNNSNMFSTPTNKAPQDVNIQDCADILDKLYGKSWRGKADKLLPNSVPRNQVIPMKDRAVQTERKPVNRGRYISVSDDVDSDSSFKDLKSRKDRTKKITRKNTKQRNSFINDQSSESGCESLYYSALSNPRVSNNSTKPKSSVPSIASKVSTICDPDTENESDNQTREVTGRKLLFSEDEDDSSTSEFEPGDDVPPKSTKNHTTHYTKPVKKTPKVNSKTESIANSRKYEKQYTFLESLSQSVPMSNAHPDAKQFRTGFSNKKEILCNYLYKLYNEKVFDNKLPNDMSIEWNIRMRGTAGFCYNKRSIKTLGGVKKSSRIVLSTKVLDTPDRLRDTLIHEMCHAAAWLINDVSDGHGPFWTGWANKAMKVFPELPQIRRCHDYDIKTKFTYRCVSCGYSIGRHSKSLDIEKKRCGHCYGKFELLINKTTKSGTVQMQTPKREPSAFALYVKENYNSVKRERNLRHAEIMKVLGQQFSAIKIAKRQDNVENDPDISG